MAELATGILDGDRRALARAITLAESTRADHREQAESLLATLLPHCGSSIRIGISGSPGVGKSSFIEAFGLHLVGQGHRVAVLAVDPSSRVSGGSILGDKTRMEELSRHPAAFIRPSPAGRSLGGVARRTRECVLICEAAGFDVVIVETVGVGQSETAVAEMTDLFLLLLAPAAGDELQGIKKGIVELADMIAVNKADGNLVEAANHAAADYRNALHMIRPASPNWRVPVLTCSALTGDGIVEIWQTIADYRETRSNSGEFDSRRADQARAWMWSEIEENLIAALRGHPDVVGRVAGLEADVAAGKTAPSAAAKEMLVIFLGANRAEAP
ncbi:MAG: methylmalonyl Co-A mutase-associated GTPase MeaB [Rickettsiales bacterium]